MCTKYEVSMFNPMTDMPMSTMPTMYDRQSMIILGSLVDKPNDPKISSKLSTRSQAPEVKTKMDVLSLACTPPPPL